MTPLPVTFPMLVQDFFQRRLVAERGVSAHTLASYRDTFTLFLRDTEQRTGKAPTSLTLEDLSPPSILAFLDRLETERGNSPRTRNLRLTALRSFMRYVAIRDPASLPLAQRVLAIASKRVDYPSWASLRERRCKLCSTPRTAPRGAASAMPSSSLCCTTRERECLKLIGLRVADLLLDRAPAVHLHGKGRKERVVPLWKQTAAQVREWLPRIDRTALAPVFPNRAGRPLTRSGVEHRLQVAIATAARRCPSLAARSISPHTLRHYLPFLTMSRPTIPSWLSWPAREDLPT